MPREQTKPIWGSPAGIRGAIVQNKPNFGELAGWTRDRLYKQDAPDKSRDQPNRSSIFAQKRGSTSDSATFVVGVKQTQSWGARRELGAGCAKQDAPDKSRDQPNRSSILAWKRRSKPGLGTFVVGVKQSQFAPSGQGRPSPRPEALTMPPITGGQACETKSKGSNR